MSITILDGGMGRELLRIGAPFRQPEWSALALMEAPDFVARVHRSFVEAGADVITSNSYAVVPFHLGADVHARRGAELARLAGQLARQVADAAPRAVRVAASLPPVGGSYQPDSFDAPSARPVLRMLVENLRPSADLWLGETLSCTAEGDLVREVLGDDARPLWLSFTLRQTPESVHEPRLRSGESVELALETALRARAEALLFNCSQPEVMLAAVKGVAALRERAGSAAASLRIGVYANAFRPETAGQAANEGLSELRKDVSPTAYLDFAREWVKAGAEIVGGCCGIGPEHIRELARALVRP